MLLLILPLSYVQPTVGSVADMAITSILTLSPKRLAVCKTYTHIHLKVTVICQLLFVVWTRLTIREAKFVG